MLILLVYNTIQYYCNTLIYYTIGRIYWYTILYYSYTILFYTIHILYNTTESSFRSSSLPSRRNCSSLSVASFHPKRTWIVRKYSNKNSYKADTKDPSKCDDDLRWRSGIWTISSSCHEEKNKKTQPLCPSPAKFDQENVIHT